MLWRSLSHRRITTRLLIGCVDCNDFSFIEWKKKFARCGVVQRRSDKKKHEPNNNNNKSKRTSILTDEAILRYLSGEIVKRARAVDDRERSRSTFGVITWQYCFFKLKKTNILNNNESDAIVSRVKTACTASQIRANLPQKNYQQCCLTPCRLTEN